MVFRRMLKRCYLNKITNEDIFERVETTRSLVNEIKKKQTTFFGHVMRKNEMEQLERQRKLIEN